MIAKLEGREEPHNKTSTKHIATQWEQQQWFNTEAYK